MEDIWKLIEYIVICHSSIQLFSLDNVLPEGLITKNNPSQKNILPLVISYIFLFARDAVNDVQPKKYARAHSASETILSY